MSAMTIAITGGSSGIGLATAQIFLRAGAAVAICGRSAARLHEAEKTLRAEHAQARLLAFSADVLDESNMAAFAQATAQNFGHVSALVNNAGQGRVSTFASTSDAEWLEELQLKFFSVLRPTRAFLPYLEKSTPAAIVCVNSLLALQPEPHMVATSAARAGAMNLLRSLATELAPKNIRVNGILIGLVESGQWRRRYETRENRAQTWADFTQALAVKKGIQLGRLGLPNEAAQAIFHLATPLSSYTTGSHIDVSGGLARHI
jgi:NAD(P)-dependent dehydrogenase (short-subunit alcohol dehydrogenase family)